MLQFYLLFSRKKAQRPGPESPVNSHSFRGLKPPAPSGIFELRRVTSDGGLLLVREIAAEWGKSWLFGLGKGRVAHDRVFGLGTNAKKIASGGNGSILGRSREGKMETPVKNRGREFEEIGENS